MNVSAAGRHEADHPPLFAALIWTNTTQSCRSATAGMTDAARRPLTVEDCLALKLVQDARISPDGEQVVFTLADQWKHGTPHPRSELWIVAGCGANLRVTILSDWGCRA